MMAARRYTREAIDTLVLAIRDGKPGEAAMAANFLLDRGCGKPRQRVGRVVRTAGRDRSSEEFAAIVLPAAKDAIMADKSRCPTFSIDGYPRRFNNQHSRFLVLIAAPGQYVRPRRRGYRTC